jgi:hypothetical protein
LKKAAGTANGADAIALVGARGINVDGKHYPCGRGFLNHAMKAVQGRKGHVNGTGDAPSLSAWRQWHVLRNGRLMTLVELKDPALANTRSRQFTGKSFEEVRIPT